MSNTIGPRLAVVPLLSSILLAGCVSQGKYDALQTQNQELQQQVTTLSSENAAAKAQLGRLQGAIKYSINSDLAFAPGGWQLSERGKRIITTMATKLAATQQNKIAVNGYTDNTPIGPELAAQGVTTNLILSQKRAEAVMAFLISKGVKPDLLSAQGFGDGNPVAPNTTSAGRAKNRRVELALVPPG